MNTPIQSIALRLPLLNALYNELLKNHKAKVEREEALFQEEAQRLRTMIRERKQESHRCGCGAWVKGEREEAHQQTNKHKRYESKKRVEHPNAIGQFIWDIKQEIYARLEAEECKEDTFDELSATARHEELNDAINIMWSVEVDRLLCEFGIGRAFSLMIEEFGEVKKTETPLEKMMLYAVIDHTLTLSHDEYLVWVKDNS